MLTRADKPTAKGFYPLWLSSTPEELAQRKQESLAFDRDANGDAA